MDDDAVVNAFVERLEKRELNGHLMYELATLSYDQLILLGKTLADKTLKKQSAR